MNNLADKVNSNSEKIPYLFLLGGVIALINTLCRADYNLVLYLYMYYIWTYMNNIKESQAHEKISSFYILAFSLIVDICWCIFWGNKWGTLQHDEENFLHKSVLVLSWINIIVKLGILAVIGIIEMKNIKASLPSKLQEKINSNYQKQIDQA